MKGRPAPTGPTGPTGPAGAMGLSGRSLAVRSISITGPDGAPSVRDAGDERQGLLDFVLPAGPTGPGWPGGQRHGGAGLSARLTAQPRQLMAR